MVSSLFYDIIIFIARFVQYFGQFFSSKIKSRYRTLRCQNLVSPLNRLGKHVLVHCASHGEYEQVLPLIHLLKTKDHFITISFFSSSGYQIADKQRQGDQIVYLPLDCKSKMKQFLAALEPDLMIIVKYEIWPNLIHVLNKNRTPVFLISARFFKDQIYFKWYGNVMKEALKKLSAIFVENQSSADLLSRINIESTMTGDTRADRVVERKLKNQEGLPVLESWAKSKRVIVFGSVWPEDWNVVKSCAKFLEEDGWSFVIAPHEISTSFVADIRNSLHRQSALWKEGNSLESSIHIIIDTVGVLAEAYKVADVGFVGGAFKQGLHNVFEPAVYGIPILTGPRIQHFHEAKELESAGGLFRIMNSDDLIERLNELKNVETRAQAGMKAAEYVCSVKGSTAKVYEAILPFLK